MSWSGKILPFTRTRREPVATSIPYAFLVFAGTTVAAQMKRRQLRVVTVSGDLIILSSLMFRLKQLGASWGVSLIVPFSGLLLALAVGPLVKGIYAMPFMAAAVVAYMLYRRRRRSTDDT